MSGPSNGGGGNFGGGANTPSFDCAAVSIKTNIISPDPAVLTTVVAGDVLTIRLQTATGPLTAITTANAILGAVFTTDPTSLIDCISQGYSYKATILNITGGNVQILITNQ